jgi:hypothetical protein
MHIKTEILKDYRLPASASVATAKTQTKSQYDWVSFLISTRASQLATTLGNSKIYKLAVEHGISCQFCDMVSKESVACPTIEERLECKQKPGRPRLRRV